MNGEFGDKINLFFKNLNPRRDLFFKEIQINVNFWTIASPTHKSDHVASLVNATCLSTFLFYFSLYTQLSFFFSHTLTDITWQKTLQSRKQLQQPVEFLHLIPSLKIFKFLILYRNKHVYIIKKMVLRWNNTSIDGVIWRC